METDQTVAAETAHKTRSRTTTRQLKKGFERDLVRVMDGLPMESGPQKLVWRVQQRAA